MHMCGSNSDLRLRRCRIIVGIDMPRVLLPTIETIERDSQRPWLITVDGADEPVVAIAARNRGIFADFALDDPRLVPNRRHLLKEFDLRLPLVRGRLIVPQDPLQRAVGY